MHNNIMAAGSRDRPPMLATGRYAQWRSRFLRYIDTRPNGDALRKCILKGPYTPTIVTTPAVPATEDSPAVPEQTTVETVMNMTPENRAHFESEKEAIHLILTGIGDEIYSTVDACQTAQEMWEAIERLQQGESLNIQDVKTNLFWEFGQFTSHDGETIESYYTRFYKMMNEMIRNNLTVATMQVNVQFLQQLQPEWSRFVIIVKQQHKLDEATNLSRQNPNPTSCHFQTSLTSPCPSKPFTLINPTPHMVLVHAGNPKSLKFESMVVITLSGQYSRPRARICFVFIHSQQAQKAVFVSTKKHTTFEELKLGTFRLNDALCRDDDRCVDADVFLAAPRQ
ncbi:hypothetical protein Tco_0890221 [Tanacetum coccineum]|uniref:Gag-Pol polyprotein n=1 Tax=Tanacetum coccineum TaxID=301880 RepID=A0ABQ5C187_9ASTR